MKKQYTTPALDIVSLISTEIIVTSSKLGIGEGTSSAAPMYGKSRNPIWEEDE